jgi:acyl-CoA synthetase (AMP-forming)/AMP-acid ligase II
LFDLPSLFIKKTVDIQPQNRVLLAHPPSLEFLCAFLGCLLANVIAIPIYPLHPAKFKQQSNTLINFIEQSGAKAILTTTKYRRATLISAWMSRLHATWYATDEWKSIKKSHPVSQMV